MKLSRDGWTGLAALAASSVLFALTLDLKPSPLVPIGPGFYPRIVLGISAALALALIIFDLRGGKGEARKGIANPGLVVAVFAVFGLYVGALPYIGYRLATFFFVAALQATLEPPQGVKGWIIVGITALATMAITYLVFEKYLQVFLPRGRWTDF